VNIPLWDRVLRIIFGKISKFSIWYLQFMNFQGTYPKIWTQYWFYSQVSNCLYAFEITIKLLVQVQMTVPFFLLANVTFNLRSLLRPFRIIHEMGFEFDELQEKYRPLIWRISRFLLHLVWARDFAYFHL
jgi:hypothetical protein